MMGFSMEMRLEQRCEMKMEQRQLLVHNLLMPKGISWKESSPLKTVKFDGHYYVEISENELRSYANGCRNIASVMDAERPDAVIVSLRGAYPVSRCVDYFAQSRIPRVHVKTSYFLNHLARKVDKALYNCERKGRFNKVLMIDTSVTGRKLSWFLPQMLGSLAKNVKSPLEFVTAVLWNDKEGWKETTEREYGKILNKNYNFGVENLICEDSPTLLGVKYDYSKDRCHAAAYSKVNAYNEPVAADIHVITSEGTKVIKLERNGRIGSTADLFVDLIGKYV